MGSSEALWNGGWPGAGQGPLLPAPGAPRHNLRSALGLGLSLIVHAAVLALSILVVVQPHHVEAPLTVIDVQLLPQDTLQPPAAPAAENIVAATAETADAAAEAPQKAQEAMTPPGVEEAKPSGAGMIRPDKMLSAEVLNQPKNRAAREGLKTLDSYGHAEQLCDVEAIEQIAKWKNTLEPEGVVAYAREETSLAENVFTAKGAAFQSHGDWYELHFECTLGADLTEVTGFAFEVGAIIPRSQWNEFGLTAEDHAD